MARLPAIRVSYQNDANYLLRLVDAIERDNKRPPDWRKKMISKVKEIALEFINAPPAIEPMQPGQEVQRKGRKHHANGKN